MEDFDPAANAAMSVALLRQLIKTLVANGTLSSADAADLVKVVADGFRKDTRFFSREASNFLGKFSDELGEKDITG